MRGYARGEKGAWTSVTLSASESLAGQMALRCLEHVVWSVCIRCSLACLQTRPTCHNQLAVKADGEMRSPLGEQRWPVFRDGAGRLSSYRAAMRSNHAAMITTLTEARFASERAGERPKRRATRPLSASAKPIQSFSRDFNGLKRHGPLPVCHSNVYPRNSGYQRDRGYIIGRHTWRTFRAFKRHRG